MVLHTDVAPFFFETDPMFFFVGGYAESASV